MFTRTNTITDSAAFFMEEAILDPPFPEVVHSTTATPYIANQNTSSSPLAAATALQIPRPPRRMFQRSKGGSFKRVGGGLVLASMPECPSPKSAEDDWSDRWQCRSGVDKSSIGTRSSEKAIQG
ncbi:hypothetical protein C8Q75DRAFT_896183 [Abortiporus biennis]|nr:hypothetical protein C8Q75DRAFT_896183 [Abortiporus biennis]